MSRENGDAQLTRIRPADGAARLALGEMLAGHRIRAGLTQEALGRAVHTSRSNVAGIERGRQGSMRSFWLRVDAVIGANGALVAAYEASCRFHEVLLVHGTPRSPALPPYVDGAVQVPHRAGAVSATVLEAHVIMAAHESSRHAADAGGGVGSASIEQVQAEVWSLARQFANMSPLRLLAEARQARDRAYTLLDRTRRPAQTTDLYSAAGQLCGLMALASFDLAVWDAAEEQARAALVYAELVDHAGLRAWTRGTQALIAYWSGRARQALTHVEAGLDGAPAGSARARLHCIEARAWSHVGGDPARVTAALQAADDALVEGGSGEDLHDVIGGEFGWGPSRHAACAGTALLALGDPGAAIDRTETALRMLPDDPFSGLVVERAHVDLASAELALGDVDAAVATLEPVWSLPVPQRRHGLTERLTRMAQVAVAPSWHHNRQAAELRDRIEVFTAEAQARSLPSG
jgi:hypothetical protein